MATRLSELRCNTEVDATSHGLGPSETEARGGTVSFSSLQCDTAQYVAELSDSLAEMAKRNKLTTLAALLSLAAREAETIGARGPTS